MGRTEQRPFVVGSIACLLALSAVAGAVASDVPDAAPPDPSSLPASAVAFAERATDAGHEAPASFRNVVELMILVATCGIVVAFYSASSGGQGRKRVLMRIRRR
jgi:hypothetical protein